MSALRQRHHHSQPRLTRSLPPARQVPALRLDQLKPLLGSRTQLRRHTQLLNVLSSAARLHTATHAPHDPPDISPMTLSDEAEQAGQRQREPQREPQPQREAEAEADPDRELEQRLLEQEARMETDGPAGGATTTTTTAAAAATAALDAVAEGTPPAKHRKIAELDVLLADEKPPVHPLETMQRLVITSDMRKHTLEWLSSGLSALRLDIDVFALAGRYFDEFLCCLKVKPRFLQVIAAACASLAMETLSSSLSPTTSPTRRASKAPASLSASLPTVLQALRAPFSVGDVQRMQAIVVQRLGDERVHCRVSLVGFIKALVEEIDWCAMPRVLKPRRVLDDIPEDEAVAFGGQERQQVLGALLHRVPVLIESYELISSFRLSVISVTALLAALDAIFGPNEATAAVKSRVRVPTAELEKCAWRMAGSMSMDFSVVLGATPAPPSESSAASSLIDADTAVRMAE